MYHSTFPNPGLRATGHAAPTPKHPPVTSPCSPVLSSISVVMAVPVSYFFTGGFGECCPKEIPLGKAEEPVWSVPCFAFDNPLTLGCASSSPCLLSALPGSRLRDGHATGGRAPASASAPDVASLGTSTAFPRPSDLI